MEQWLEEWEAKVRPLRERFGFSIVGAWRHADEEFVWLLRYDGPLSWEEADRAYYESKERRQLAPDPARHLAAVDHVVLTEVQLRPGGLAG